MAISTRFPITLEIDEKSFSITVKNTTTSEEEEKLERAKTKHTESFDERDKIQAELSEAKEEFEINKAILEHGDIKEKIKVMLPQKALNKKIFQLQKDIAEFDKNIISLDKAMEELFEQRYELAVSGTDKASLKKEVTDLGISYRVLFTEFSKEINKFIKEKEKK